MSGHYPTHGVRAWTPFRVKSPFFKKIKITQTIPFLAKENEARLHRKLLYKNKVRTALLVGRQTRGSAWAGGRAAQGRTLTCRMQLSCVVTIGWKV